MDVANISPDWEVIDRVPSCTQGHLSYKLLTMKVNSPKRPQVPVAAHWQQSGRGAKNLPDDSLPIPQVPISTPKRTTPAEKAAQKTPKHSSSSVSSRKVTFRQPKTNCQPKTRKVPDNHYGLNIGTWNVRILRTAGN